jgi:hypothetical protein
MNIVDGHDQDDQERYYPRKGKPGRSPASSHAFADVEIGRGVVEIKPLSLINDGFIPELLDVPKTFLADVVQKYGTNKGFLFKFSPPSSFVLFPQKPTQNCPVRKGISHFGGP